VSETKQRWRIVFARDEDAQYLSHLDSVKAWERSFRRGEIPVAVSEGFNPRSKLVMAAPLQLGMLAEHELADLYLADKLTAADLRTRLVGSMPRGYRVVDLFDVWIGAPALAPQLVAADYRLVLLNVKQADLEGAVTRFMASAQVLRERKRGAKLAEYDLRPLVLDARTTDIASVASDAAADEPAVGLWLRLRHSQAQGTGRAEEVVAALAEDSGLALRRGPTDDAETDETNEPEAGETGKAVRGFVEIVRPVRERLWLVGEPGF
jgi:radical SAM-linked protein